MSDDLRTETVLDPKVVQGVHRRILAAREEGREPAAEDLAIARAVNESPFAGFDRAWARDAD